MTRLRLLVVILVALGTASAETAGAAVILDQVVGGPSMDTLNQGVGGGGVGGGTLEEIDAAQTFTVGAAGTLDSVDVHIIRNVPALILGIDMLAQVFMAAGDLPVGSPLATVVVPETSLPATHMWFNIDFSSFAIPIDVGDEIAIVLGDNNSVLGHTMYAWDGCHPSCYAEGGGSLEFGNGGFAPFPNFTADLFLRTYTSTIPEPTSAVLIGLGLAILGSRSRAK